MRRLWTRFHTAGRTCWEYIRSLLIVAYNLIGVIAICGECDKVSFQYRADIYRAEEGTMRPWREACQGSEQPNSPVRPRSGRRGGGIFLREETVTIQLGGDSDGPPTAPWDLYPVRSVPSPLTWKDPPSRDIPTKMRGQSAKVGGAGLGKTGKPPRQHGRLPRPSAPRVDGMDGRRLPGPNWAWGWWVATPSLTRQNPITGPVGPVPCRALYSPGWRPVATRDQRPNEKTRSLTGDSVEWSRYYHSRPEQPGGRSSPSGDSRTPWGLCGALPTVRDSVLSVSSPAPNVP
ncbi:uncharacterized protein N7482_009526 [Penicillium canariense]|uniref:Uncharacterized protein n=1 Tax=Penicillium canariense TaxID=189055 RepID=A0A9W9HMR3_9EURO|nr:uncharacterized protein N7482_009526 [Penicillium canariense]KAJ5153048.1 hypothetical protein N7482_009526 [Penicillium canariense]